MRRKQLRQRVQRQRAEGGEVWEVHLKKKKKIVKKKRAESGEVWEVHLQNRAEKKKRAEGGLGGVPAEEEGRSKRYEGSFKALLRL